MITITCSGAATTTILTVLSLAVRSVRPQFDLAGRQWSRSHRLSEAAALALLFCAMRLRAIELRSQPATCAFTLQIPTRRWPPPTLAGAAARAQCAERRSRPAACPQRAAARACRVGAMCNALRSYAPPPPSSATDRLLGQGPLSIGLSLCASPIHRPYIYLLRRHRRRSKQIRIEGEFSS